MAPPGGVCAVLDYEVSQMTDYVAEMTYRLVIPATDATKQFRKFVSQILTSTRLPSTTILLGMNYLARQTNYLKAQHPVFKPSEGEVWRMLTMGLLLGSKFLDDNTFQNRSWSEVSGIPVAELNKMETDWLLALDWKMYVNLDKSSDFQAWLADWNAWRTRLNIANKATLDRLAPLVTPINTNVQRTRPYQQPYNAYPGPASRERPQSGSVSATTSMLSYYQEQDRLEREQQIAFARASAEAHQAWKASQGYPTPQLTPPSAPDSGYSTPEYPSATGGNPRFNDWSVYQQYSRGFQQPPAHSTYIAPHVAAYHTPIHSYPQGYGAGAWDNHYNEGNCNCCLPQQKNPYSVGYVGQQLVAT